MSSPSPHAVTELLQAWSNGDDQAFAELIPLVYAELHRIANRSLRQLRHGHTLQPTALINEAFLKLIGQERAQWVNRQQFFAVAAELMQRILLDYARRRSAAKRGGQAQRLALDDLSALPEHPSLEISEAKLLELLSVEQALQKLHELDPDKSRVVTLRYVIGLSLEETAEVLGLSLSTVTRHWRTARAFLKRELMDAPERTAPRISEEVTTND